MSDTRLAAFANCGGISEVAFPVWGGGADAGALARLLDGIQVESAALGDPAVDWPGLWRVVYAPHIYTLGSLALSKFDVYYDISPTLEVRSFVRFEGPFGRGWLNAAGTIRTLDTQLEVPGRGPRPTSEVAFTDFWVDMGAPLPRRAPGPEDEAMSRLAAVGFIKELSQFPTLLFDGAAGFTVFRFPPLGVEIAARRVGPSGAELRPLQQP